MIAVFGLCQLGFENSSSSFIAPSTGRGDATSQGEVTSLPLWLVLASAQPAAAITDANSYDGSFAYVAALTVTLAAVVFSQRSRIAHDPLSIASVPTAQQRRQMIVPLGAVVVAPASACYAKKDATEVADAAAKAKQDVAAALEKENKADQEAREEAARAKKEAEEYEKKKADEKKQQEWEAKKESGGSSFDTLFQVLAVGLGVASVLPKPKTAGDEGAAEEAKEEDSAPNGEQAAPEEAKEEDSAPKGEQAAPKVEEPQKDEPEKEEAQIDELNKDEPNKEEANKDEAKKDEAKQEEAKKDEAKNDEPNKDEAKKAEA